MGAFAGRLRSHQRRAWKGDCIGAHQQGDGCLQFHGWFGWELPGAKLLVLAGESSGCAGSVQRAPRVQGRSQGGALRRRGVQISQRDGLDVKSAELSYDASQDVKSRVK